MLGISDKIRQFYVEKLNIVAVSIIKLDLKCGRIRASRDIMHTGTKR